MPETAAPQPSSWSRHDVEGTPCDVFQPRAVNERGFVLLYLHDEDDSPGLNTQPFMTVADQYGLPVVVPRCGPTWWLDQPISPFHATLSPEAFLLEKIMPWIEQRFETADKAIGLMGDGMGGQGALKLAYKHPRRFPVVAAIAPKIDFHYLIRDGHDLLCDLFQGEEEAARQQTAILYVQALNWPQFQFFCADPADYFWWDGADRLRMKLAASGIPFDSELESEATAGGDALAYFRLMLPRAMEYVATNLERERLRVV